jgi:uncharacterized protein YukE
MSTDTTGQGIVERADGTVVDTSTSSSSAGGPGAPDAAAVDALALEGAAADAGALATVARTDFGSMDDQTILKLIHEGYPDLLSDMGETWSALGVSLRERATDLELEFRRLEPTWTGDSAEQYAASVRSLMQATTVVGTMAGDLGEVIYSSASALSQVCAMFPAPAGMSTTASNGGVS